MEAVTAGTAGVSGAEEAFADEPSPAAFAHPGERIDDLQRNGLRIIQDPAKFCFGMDAVLLSAFVTAKPSDTILDLCTGNGVIPLLLSARTEAFHITGLEIQRESVSLARRSVEMNGLSARITIDEGDVKNAAERYGASSFSVVTCNPPYMIASHGLKNPDDAKNIARHEILCTWEDIVRETARLLMPKGRFFLVHRPFRLPELLTSLSMAGLEPKRLRLVYPYLDKAPNMVLLEAVRGGKPRLSVEPPLIIYREAGVYTEEVRTLYDS